MRLSHTINDLECRLPSLAFCGALKTLVLHVQGIAMIFDGQSWDDSMTDALAKRLESIHVDSFSVHTLVLHIVGLTTSRYLQCVGLPASASRLDSVLLEIHRRRPALREVVVVCWTEDLEHASGTGREGDSTCRV